jgi:hypothetical protein
MKKIFMTLCAAAAIVACSKTEVQYEAAGEIGFMPAARNVTKATVDGVSTLPTDQALYVFANYGQVNPNTTVSAGVGGNVGSFNIPFLKNAKFVNQNVAFTSGSSTTTVNAWAGAAESYGWPNSGSLIFAGYSSPKDVTIGANPSYDFSTDVLTINDYVQSTNTSSTFDLAWFGRTAQSYNNNTSPTTPVGVTLSHALSCIQIYVKGEGSTISTTNPWKIKSIVLNNIYTKGDVSCTGSGVNNATWSGQEVPGSMTIYSSTTGQTLTDSATLCENVTNGTLVIPQVPAQIPSTPTGQEIGTLTITYTYNTQGGGEMPDQTATVSLYVDANGWKSGYKYTYTLTFKSSEIMVSPSYNPWTTTNPSVTVE